VFEEHAATTIASARIPDLINASPNGAGGTTVPTGFSAALEVNARR